MRSFEPFVYFNLVSERRQSILLQILKKQQLRSEENRVQTSCAKEEQVERIGVHAFMDPS